MKQLHSMMKYFSGGKQATLGWYNSVPFWFHDHMLVHNDPNLSKYLGDFQLNHFRDELKNWDDVFGYYPLSVKHGHITIQQRVDSKKRPNSLDLQKVLQGETVGDLTDDGITKYGAKDAFRLALPRPRDIIGGRISGILVDNVQLKYALSLEEDMKVVEVSNGVKVFGERTSVFMSYLNCY